MDQFPTVVDVSESCIDFIPLEDIVSQKKPASSETNIFKASSVVSTNFIHDLNNTRRTTRRQWISDVRRDSSRERRVQNTRDGEQNWTPRRKRRICEVWKLHASGYTSEVQYPSSDNLSSEVERSSCSEFEGKSVWNPIQSTPSEGETLDFPFEIKEVHSLAFEDDDNMELVDRIKLRRLRKKSLVLVDERFQTD